MGMVSLLSRERYTREAGMRELGAEGETVKVGGRDVHYVRRGPRGGTPVLLVHGFFYHTFMWRETIEALSPRLDCVALDLFGFGFSERPRAPHEVRYGYDLWTDQVEGFLAALGIGRAHLVGQSLGAATIMSFAARRPERAERVVLVDPAGIPNPLKGDGGALTWPIVGEVLFNLPGRALMKKVLRDFFMCDPAKVTDAYTDEVTRPGLIEGTTAAALWIMRNVDLGGIEDRVRAFGALGKKTMLIWGREDRAIPLSNAARFEALLKPEKTLVIDRAGHVPHQERPEVANPEILAFLEGKSG